MECDEIAKSDSPDAFFAGVRFVLLGFDSVSESQYRAELVRRGAVDVGRYDQICTHVIVSGRVYDDPVCVAARNDGKILVTELWIEDSVDFLAAADASRIIYRPVRDFDGIPGSDKLCICLTGYQRRERDDIMKMVELMGATFSKPLIATKITHLICYKFEGEKYELAKKVNIKLVNHRWLEDCLKVWQILPIDDYTRSGWELEMEEAEAKDSEEEMDTGNTRALITGSTTGISSPLINIQKSRNLGLPLQAKSVSKLVTGSVNASTESKKNHSHNEGHDERHPVASDISLPTAHPSVSTVDLKKNENILSIATGTPHKDTSTPINSKDGKMPLQSGSSTVKNLESYGDLLGDVAQHGCNSVLSTKHHNQNSFELFDTCLGSSDLLSSKKIESCNKLPQKRKAEIIGNLASSPNSELRNCGAHSSGSPSTNSKSMIDGLPIFTDGAKCNQKVPCKKSPLSRVISKDLPGGHDFGPSAASSSSYSRRHLEKRQPLFGVHNLDNAFVTDRSSTDGDKAWKEVNSCAGPSSDMQSIVHDISRSGDSSTNKSINTPSREPMMMVNKDNLSSGPSAYEKTTNDLTKHENEKTTAADISNDSLNIQAVDIGQQEPKPSEGILNAESIEDQCAKKIRSTPNKFKKDLAMKKLGNRLRVANRVSTSKRGLETGKVTTDNATTLLDLEKNKEPHVINVITNLPADTVPKQDDFTMKKIEITPKSNSKKYKIEASPKSSSKSSSRKLQMDVVEGHIKPGKENIPTVDHLRTNSKCSTKKMSNKHGGKLEEENDKVPVTCRKDSNGDCNKRMLIFEPVCFLLSGHRFERKEFRQVIKHLRGRVCRDSHQWSYQATHFIVPEPVRRTEKFFAAAAAGRWILKTDYLMASKEAGKFLDEESFEWHKNGLTEDGAISLAAPRKWRKLRERTGHGALYGMRIIVYGECIMPSLDTLKRVVKAGDGTILATSPPYTRFLTSGVDFAIISPGMPRVDVWIQEFLRHEIPCVLVDYLVEYVCKPGYPLERHVLFNTVAWAAKSFANLESRLEEIVCDDAPSSEVDDLPCVVCGSRDRAEVMLICGNEAGTVGCGVGTHIECCDPPLDAVPAEDWFCCKCSEVKLINETVKGKKKKRSSKKPR